MSALAFEIENRISNNSLCFNIFIFLAILPGLTLLLSWIYFDFLNECMKCFRLSWKVSYFQELGQETGINLQFSR